MQATSSQPVQAVSWPPPAQGGASLAEPRGIFVNQRGNEAKIKIAAIVYGIFALLCGGVELTPRKAAAPAGEALGVLLLLAQLVLGLMFLNWVFKVHQNMAAFRAAKTPSPNWAILCYFIPLINWFRPLRNMIDVWKASDPSVNSADAASWRKGKRLWILEGWWLLFIASNLSLSLILPSPSGPRYSAVDTFAGLIIILAGVTVMLRVISLVNTRQEAKELAVQAGG